MAEQRGAASAAELEAILAVIPDIYFRVDAQNIIRSYAAGRSSRLYVAPELFLNRRLDEVLPRDTAALLTDGLQRARAHRTAVRIAYTLPMPAGDMPFVADLHPLDSGDVVAVVRDESAAQAAARTREELEHLRQIVPSAVFTVDREKRITSWNRRAEEITGFAAAEMLGQPCTLFAEQPCRDGCGLFDDGVPKPIHGRQCRIRTRDGQQRKISKNVDVLRDAQGAVCGGIESFDDVTDLHTAREQVAALQRETEAILARIPVGVWLKDRAGVLLHCNAAAAALHGMTPAQMQGRTFAELMPERAARAQAQDAQVLQGGEPLTVVEEQQWQGRTRWVYIEKVPYRDGTGTITGVLSVTQDITATREAEERVRRSEERYRRIIETARDAVLLFGTADDTVVAANPRAALLLRTPAGALCGSSWRTWFDPTALPALAAAVTAGGGLATGVQARPAAGDPVPVEVSLTVVADGGQNLAVAFIRDVSERTAAETEVARYRDHLEEMVTVRTAELARVNRELEAFAYSVAHDLRAPLRAIDGYGQALSEDHAAALPAEAQHYLARIRSGAQRLGRIIDDLLDLSRVARHELRQETVDLSALAHEVVRELQAAQPERVVTVELTDGLQAQGDPRLLRLLLQNLLDNAWKFTGRTAAARITFTADADHGTVRYTVADNGAGYDPRYAEKLFQPFQRLHRDDEFPGTGIGLPVAQRIVHRHGGEITATGAPGTGAAFTFTLG